MRIDTLELRAFGPFTDKILDLAQPELGLHVIFGRNEAGKSSALRALEATLFGIHPRTADDFVHEYTALRLAMTLRNAKGEQLAFARRKATKDPVRDWDDGEVLPGGALRAFLCGVDAEEFERVFALDHVRLREGSDRLLDAAEGADAAIVGAALGVNHLRDVRSQIEAEAAAIFSARKKKTSIHVAIAAWKQHKKDLRERSLSSGAWSSAEKAAAAAKQARDKAIEHEKELRRRGAEFQFVRRNRPRVERLVDLRAKLVELAGVPDLDVGFAARRLEADTHRHEPIVRLKQLLQDEAALREDLASLAGDFTFVEREQDVQELRDLSSQAAKGREDRERLEAKAELAAAERDRNAGKLGLEVPLSEAVLGDLRLALGARERCEELLQEHTRITTTQKQVAGRIADRQRQLDFCNERLAGSGAAVDFTSLDVAVTAARKLGDPDVDLAALRTELGARDRTIAEALAGLRGFAGEVAELGARPVPGPEALETFAQRFREVEDEARRARHRREELGEQRADLVAEIDRLLAEQPVPSGDDLAATRGRRDAQWRLVRRAWLEAADVDALARAIDADRPLAESFERSIEGSDDLVDRLRRASDRVATLAEHRRQLAQKDEELGRLVQGEGDRQLRCDELDAEWRAAWTGSGLEVRDRAAMKDVLVARQQILDLLADRRRTGDRAETLATRVAAAGAALQQALAALGVEVADAERDGSLAPILRLADARRAALVEEREARDKDAAARARLGAELREAQDDLVALDEERQQWTVAFSAATRGLPMGAEDPPDTVLPVLRQVELILQRSEEAAGLRDRIRKIDADNAEFARRLEAFRAAHAPDLPAAEPAACLAGLVGLLEAKKRDRQAFDLATHRVEEIERGRKAAEDAVEIAKRTLEDLAREAGAASVDDLPDLVRRADEKRGLRESRATIEDDLLGEGCAIEVTERRVAVLAGRELDVELELLETELKLAAADAEAKRDEALEARVAFDAMQGDTGAAAIAEAAASVEARLRDDVERYVRLVLAGNLLGTAIERFRQSHEAPMLKFASKHMAGLTNGRYTRVETDVDGKGLPFFLVRETGASAAKMVRELSDGTRDQLQLALVLGSLDHRFASGAEPMPLVLDDILVHFDDERSLAALEELAEFSRATQVLLFTHHEKIRDQAASLGRDRGVGICEL